MSFQSHARGSGRKLVGVAFRLPQAYVQSSKVYKKRVHGAAPVAPLLTAMWHTVRQHHWELKLLSSNNIMLCTSSLGQRLVHNYLSFTHWLLWPVCSPLKLGCSYQRHETRVPLSMIASVVKGTWHGFCLAARSLSSSHITRTWPRNKATHSASIKPCSPRIFSAMIFKIHPWVINLVAPQRRDGWIFESGGISLENMPT